MNLFDMIPSGFFNCLASGSNQRIYADCIQLIYKEYEREISYRIPRKVVRDAIACYFVESSAILMDEELEDHVPNEMANAVIRRFLSKDVAWLEEETDDTTYEKQIIMTENGIALAEFLERLKKPEKEEYSSYIFNIYNTLNNKAQWEDNIYVNCIKSINKEARALSGALKKLSTFIRKIIEKMVKEKTLESLTENILEYCQGNFIREYSRLTKQQNIHLYRLYINEKLQSFVTDDELFKTMIRECMEEEEVDEFTANDMVLDMIQSTKRFLVEDYDKILKDIKRKINIYIEMAVGRARFLQNSEKNEKGNVERVMSYMIHQMKETGMGEELPEEMTGLFKMNPHEFIDKDSIMYPRKEQAIKDVVETDMEELTEDAIEAARLQQLKEAANPYSKNLMKKYLDDLMKDQESMESDQLPLRGKRELLSTLSAAAYAVDNGYRIQPEEGYYETNAMLLRRFKITREKKS